MTKHKGYRGVYLRTSPRPSPYFARVRTGDRWVFSSYFKTPEEAATAYDVMAQIYFGDRAVLNFPRSRTLSGADNDGKRPLNARIFSASPKPIKQEAMDLG